MQRNFSCPECHESHPVSKYPDQKEIIKTLKEIQKRKDERKRQQRRNSEMHEEKLSTRKFTSVNDEVKEEETEDCDIEKSSTENLELKDDEDNDFANLVQKTTSNHDTQGHATSHEVKVVNTLIAAKKKSSIHTNSAPSL